MRLHPMFVDYVFQDNAIPKWSNRHMVKGRQPRTRQHRRQRRGAGARRCARALAPRSINHAPRLACFT